MDISAMMERLDVRAAAKIRLRGWLKERLDASLPRFYAPASLPHAWNNCKRDVTYNVLWSELEAMKLVKLEVKADEGYALEDLAGDMFDVEMHADSVPGGARTIIAQRKRWEENIEKNGVWGFVGYYRPNTASKWIEDDSIWGVEWEENMEEHEAASEIRAAALAALLELLQQTPKALKIFTDYGVK